MQACNPQLIIERAESSSIDVNGHDVLIRTNSGSSYRGSWVAANHKDRALLISTKEIGYICLDTSSIESIAFPNAELNLLAILSDFEIDPLATKEALGPLAIKRRLNECSQTISKILHKQIEVKAIDLLDESLAVNSLMVLIEMLERFFSGYSSDEGALREIAANLNEVSLVPDKTCQVNLTENHLRIKFHWNSAKGRWTQKDLHSSLNQTF